MTLTASIARPGQLFIGGKWVTPSSDAVIDVINSGTEELFARVSEARAEDVNRAVEAARNAFDSGPWPHLSHAQRGAYLTKIAAELDARAADIAPGSTRVGDPFDETSQMGPLAMRRQRERVESYIARGTAEGAVLATGGRRPPHLKRGFYIEPTVFGNVDNHSAIAREEIFGPVLSVIRAGSEAEAITIANDTEYGLNASIFTNDVDRAYAAARQLRSGTVGHNGLRTDFGIAFGGFKQSGMGREGGIEGLLPFLEAKTLLLEEWPAHISR